MRRTLAGSDEVALRVAGVQGAPLVHVPAGIAKAVGKALGKEPKIVLYDPEKLGLGKGGKAEGFPFRCVGGL